MQTVLFDGQPISPSKVVCIGRNYVEHIAELNNEVPTEPVIFVKPNSAISTDMTTHAVDAIHYEAEISLLIDDNQFVGVAVGLDLTKREVQSVLKSKSLPWERAKAFDASAVFSEFVSFDQPVDSLSLVLSINDQIIQQANYQLMIYKPAEIIAAVNEFMSFEKHDILMTGTPKGVGKINQGDKFTGQIFSQDTLLVSQSWTVS
ncbi:fumarylacetoacetate hydrolase family protein [Psychromonas sp. 14N.309.X.WAT.B.A12]|uniref:fumarylacetoacetate hydrolase family protein n=1 Tax=unclassified Psychromonas TaxID=2614957 RepID=UPI0025B1BCA3|nr:fumarylacetoacetate hydrolase family protein [Psychromonas sp. 14N.309.X.WAT.B.A12]MDN2662419.1 fumarylacetoacetate hydrolase family protein [Psychromonas sp. 14N.309.X.WAT.B.A12]